MVYVSSWFIESNPGIGRWPEPTRLAPALQVSHVIEKLQCQVFTLLKALYTPLAQTARAPSQGRSRADFQEKTPLACVEVCACMFICACIWEGVMQGLDESLGLGYNLILFADLALLLGLVTAGLLDFAACKQTITNRISVPSHCDWLTKLRILADKCDF